ncbi:MAG: DNA primase small subunit domain-containing protein [Candidatus Bathyarchaeales archaeon]
MLQRTYGYKVQMGEYYFPRGMRLSTLEERLRFYREEFEVEKVAEWLSERTDKVRFAVIIGRHSRIYPKEYAEDASTTIIIDEYKDLEDVKTQIVEFVPEAVYYDRNVYDEDGNVIGQELAFDLDPENITCPIHGSLEDKMRRNQGLSFCELEFQMVRDATIMLYEYLAKRFSRLKIVYSGRGFHIHVFDKEAYALKIEERKSIAKDAKERGFPIDVWVTEGDMRLIRLPYSLNGLVSRMVIPLERVKMENFDPVDEPACIPNFLKTPKP